MSSLILFFLLCATTVLSEDWNKLEHYCSVQSPIDFTIFDLTTIQSDNYDTIIRLNDLEYLRVHFCNPLKDPCNGKQDYAVCLHSNNEEIGIGREPPKVTVESGKIMFRFSGDKCNNDHNYTVDFEMKCNFSMKAEIDNNLDVLYNRDECGFQMTIPTSAACSRAKQTTCDVKNDWGYFNLKPLMDLSENYIIPLNKNLSVILNVCHSLIYGQHFSECDYDTMVCLVDETDAAKPSFTRLGNVNNNVRISATTASVILDLTSDTPCGKEHTDGPETITTSIQFICKVTATNTLPQYISGFGTCHYIFKWVTAAACSEDILIKQSKVNHQACKITVPLNNQLFDLSSLEGIVNSAITSDETAEYQFSVCSPLKNSNCTKKGTGVCKYIKENNIALSKGQANANLMWRENRIYLNYTDGIACGNYQRSYTTIIFKCSKNNFATIEEEDPSEDPCTTNIVLKTSTICDHRCATPDYKFDFSHLRDHQLNYEIEDETPGTTYYMNICGPLINEIYSGVRFAVNCTHGTGICKVVEDSNGIQQNDISLGVAEHGLRTAPDGRLYLSHVNGSICEEDNSKRFSSEITFTCDEDTVKAGTVIFNLAEVIFTSKALNNYFKLHKTGLLSFEGYNNCKYHFNFKSKQACPKNIKPFTDQCVTLEDIKYFELNDLIKSHRFHINANESTGYFNGSACGESSKCHGTFVCDNWYNRKWNLTPKKKRLSTILVFKFVNKTRCKDESVMKSWLNVWCAVQENAAESFLVKDEECSIGVNWNDAVSVCEMKTNVAEDETTIPILVIVLVIVVPILILVSFYFCRNRRRGTTCMNSMHNLVVRYTSYSTVRGGVQVANNDDVADTADEDGDVATH